MKHLLTSSIVYSALLFGGFSVPCNAEILFSHYSGGGTSDLSVSGTIPGPDETVTYLTDVFNELTVMGLPTDDGVYGGLYLVETYCATDSNQCIGGETPDVIYVTGNLAALGLSDNSFSTPLLAITLASPLTGATTAGGVFSLSFPTDVSSVYVDPYFLADLGLGSNTPPLTGLANLFDGGGYGNYTMVVSASLNLDADAPEPRSWLLMTLGTASIVFLARKNRFRRVG